jgi:hypothetical protein
MKPRALRQTLAVIALLLAIVWIGSSVVKTFWFPGVPFDAKVWAASGDADNTVRWPMAARLVAQGTLKGKTRAEVAALLGGADESGDASDPYVKYYLDRYSAVFSSNSRWLTLRFGTDGRVIAIDLDYF